MKFEKIIVGLIILSMLSSLALAETTNAGITPPQVNIDVGTTAQLTITINPAEPVNSVEVIGSFDPSKITPTFTPTLVGAMRTRRSASHCMHAQPLAVCVGKQHTLAT